MLILLILCSSPTKGTIFVLIYDLTYMVYDLTYMVYDLNYDTCLQTGTFFFSQRTGN